MNRLPEHATLQRRILIWSARKPIETVAALARELGKHRSSVSRAIHRLEELQLVSQVDGRWCPTIEGHAEVERLGRELPGRTVKAAERLRDLMSQNRAVTQSAQTDPRGRIAFGSALNLSYKDEDYSIGPDPDIQLAIQDTSVQHESMAPWPMENAYEGIVLAPSRDLLNASSMIDSAFVSTKGEGPLDMVTNDLWRTAQEVGDSLLKISAATYAIPEIETGPLLYAAVRTDLGISARDAVSQIWETTSKALELFAEPQARIISIDQDFELGRPLSADAIVQPVIQAAGRFDDIVSKSQDSLASIECQWSSVSALETLARLGSAADAFDSVVGRLGLSERVSVEPYESPLTLYGSHPDTTGIVEVPGLPVSHQWDLITQKALGSITEASYRPTLAETIIMDSQHWDESKQPESGIDLSSQLRNEAVFSFSQAQQLTMAALEESVSVFEIEPSVLGQLSGVNVGLGGIVDRLGTLTMEANTGYALQQMPHVAGVARSYGGYIADELYGLVSGNRGRIGILDIVKPTTVTADYIGVIHSGGILDSDDLVRTGENSGLADALPYPDDVSSTLVSLGGYYVNMWQGSLEAIMSGRPDSIRQAAHSGRELLSQVLAELAPNTAFTAFEQSSKITRQMRVSKILTGSSKSAKSWANSMASAIDQSYDRLSGASHYREGNRHPGAREVKGLIIAAGGLLMWLIEKGRQTR